MHITGWKWIPTSLNWLPVGITGRSFWTSQRELYFIYSEKICPGSFCETCQWLKFPLNGLPAHSRVSPVVGLLPLASGPACLGMAFPPFLVKQLYKTNAQIAKELKIIPILDKLLEYNGKWIQHVNRMPRNRLPRVMKYYSQTGRRNHDRIDLWRDFWLHETGTGQQVAQLHERYIIIMMMMICFMSFCTVKRKCVTECYLVIPFD